MAYSQPELLEVVGDDGKIRTGLVVGTLGSPRLALAVERFVEKVAAFKHAAVSRQLDDASFVERTRAWRDYRREFVGRKTGSARLELDYVSYHGAVVDALREWRVSKDRHNLHITNTPLIDLLVADGERLIEVYEVKTNVDRQNLYAALGQLLVHSAGHPRAIRCLVVPMARQPADDILRAAIANGIKILTFAIDGDTDTVVIDTAGITERRRVRSIR